MIVVVVIVVVVIVVVVVVVVVMGRDAIAGGARRELSRSHDPHREAGEG